MWSLSWKNTPFQVDTTSYTAITTTKAKIEDGDFCLVGGNVLPFDKRYAFAPGERLLIGISFMISHLERICKGAVRYSPSRQHWRDIPPRDNFSE
jgi:hypothetical protein